MSSTTSGLGFAPTDKQTALRDDREHVCTPEDCPPDGRYYVSCIDDGGKVFLMAGPYRTHGEALAAERRVCQVASDVDGRAWFMAWGTCHKREGEELSAGVLNKHKLI
ncbi:MAG TPA: hypothetical protein VN861_03015 [Candidatus Acidoferrales bacterium]|nr:hypothetical protein [Candidatus Acidoferrales bacterium]